MSNDKAKRDVQSGREKIHIDYGNIDVADIMDQIKRLIASHTNGSRLEPDTEEGFPSDPSLGEEEEGKALIPPSRLKAFLLKLIKPFSPLIKLLVLPVYQELRETVINLDLTNKRLDKMGQALNDANAHFLATRQKIDLYLPFLKEYTNLFYSLAHNMVMEMTKLKIEEENIKIRIRILEKDFENLKSREKFLESRILS